MAQRRKRGELAAAKRAFWDRVPDWGFWDRLDASRPETQRRMFMHAGPWRPHITFVGGLKDERAA